LANDIFNFEPEKVVFGFCISDCSGTGSNTNATQAVEVLQELKAYNNNEFQCAMEALPFGNHIMI